MAAIIPFIPLIVSGVSGAVSAYNSHSQVRASQQAAQLEYQSTEEALKAAEQERTYQHTQDNWKNQFEENQRNYERQQYADYRARLEPTRQHLTQSFNATIPTNGPADLVTMVSPDGEQRQVPSAHVRYYEQRGARRV